MECISVFDMLKIGVGPSSSHTLGPWRAAEQFLGEIREMKIKDRINRVKIDLFGSLSLTGKGHATDLALMFGLGGQDPELIDMDKMDSMILEIRTNKKIRLGQKFWIAFDPEADIVYNRNFLPFHANGMTFTAYMDKEIYASTFYSIGGGFVVKEDANHTQENRAIKRNFPYPIEKAGDLLAFCHRENKKVSEIVMENEKSMRTEKEIGDELLRIWETMLESMFLGCHSSGVLPGGLNVRRRAYDLYQNLKGEKGYSNAGEWLVSIRTKEVKFRQILKWVSCFALAVNEVNASMGRVVTAPTNGSAGVIPAVLMYYLVIENHDADEQHIKQFLLVAGEIGSIFKKGATISAAMGGCQAEIGVSSAMAAAALCELMGGTAEQVMIAAEIAMEHHLGMTCDPIGGLVQVPCIERNTMGAVKAINAVELALETNVKNVKVSLDKVVNTMWETAKDMSSKYKETSEGGLAVGVNLSDC